MRIKPIAFAGFVIVATVETVVEPGEEPAVPYVPTALAASEETVVSVA
jgi:hypothetical protein